MLEKIKANKGKIIGNFTAVLAGTVVVGIVATAVGENVGYGAAGFYLYGLFGHNLVAKLIEKKVK